MSCSPKWKWPGFPRSRVFLDAGRARKLIERAKRKQRNGQASAAAIRAGAGFGDAKTNARVERAAVKAVTGHFKQQGYNVVSRERENCGYDLLATNGRRELHIEVKGVQGEEPSFVITENELKCASRDKNFCVAVVTSALQRSRRIDVFGGAEFRRRFETVPISYMARLKR